MVVYRIRTEASSNMQHNPPKWSRRWFIELAANILLGHITLSLPGWLLIFIAILIGVPDFAHRFEFWFAVTKSSYPGILAALASVLLWPYLSPTLAAIGLVYIVAVSFSLSSAATTPRSSRLIVFPLIGWIAAAVCFVSVVATAGIGLIEVYIRKEIAKGLRAFLGTRPN